MKKLLFFILILSNSVFGAEIEKEVKSKITKATVFLKGAQVNRASSVSFQKGKTLLKFKELSPYIDKNSIKVKGVGNFTVLSVNHNVNYLEITGQSPRTKELNDKIEKLESDIEYKKTEVGILKERKDFLVSNKHIISNEKTVSPNDYKLFKDIYYSDFESVQLSMLKKKREIEKLTKEIKILNKQVLEANTRVDLPTSEITVTISSETEATGKIDLSYYIGNAGWYPSYDIRVDDISSPVKLIYKANVYQNTGIDWKDVKLVFSNASPSESANIPVLYPYYLEFSNYSKQNHGYRYNPNIREVSGIVRDAETGEPIPYANVLIKGKTVGTTTDFDGKFSLSVPQGSKSLVVTYIGYETYEVVIGNTYIDILLNSDVLMLEAVVVAEYSTPMISRKKNKFEETTTPIEMKTVDHKTNFEFNIEIPYSLNSNSNNLTIEMQRIELNSSYIYHSIPKINPNAFLIANITDWEQYSLLDGEVNLYFENTFVGKSVLDLAQLSDTLEVSLGNDNNITIKRVKEKSLASKQFIGGNKIENRIWKTSIRNNKSESIKLIVFDQIPISNNGDIVVETEELSDGKMNTETGEVEWFIELEPKETIEKVLGYSVKYPKKKFIRID